MKKTLYFLTALFVCGLLSTPESLSIPAFARKYGFNCSMCHSGFTKLNDFGQRFRDYGYQIPGQAGKEPTVFESAPPVSMRVPLGHMTYSTSHGTTQSFNIFGFDLLAAGVLHKNVSFVLIYTPRIDLPSSLYSGRDSSNNSASQYGSLESASVVFSNIIPDALNLRVGKFEPAYHAISSKRTYYLFQPYEIYNMTTPRNSFVFDDNQIGLEAYGHFKSGFKYAVGLINGNGAEPDNNNRKDIYFNLSQTLGRGDGQSAGQRIGVFCYYGWQPRTVPGSVIGNMGQTNGSGNKTFTRLGINGSFNLKSFNLQGMYFKGSDNKDLNILKPSSNYRYTGGFFELDYAGLVNNKFVASVMYNWVTPPDYDSERKISAFSMLVRYYLGDWSAVNVSLHGEYTHHVMGDSDKIQEDIFALALDFAF